MNHRFFILFIVFVPFTLFPACGDELPEITKFVSDSKSDLFAIDFSHYQADLKPYPIGVFDSGVGGLTVLNEIFQVDEFDNRTHEFRADGRPDFEQERFLYLGDQANMPYGNYPAEGKTDFLRELILKDAIFLLGNRYWPSGASLQPRFDKSPVKAIVIACNTATSYGLQDIVTAVGHWKIPLSVIGVVNAGAKGAMENEAIDGAVAVMATVGTCSSQGYVRAIESIARQRNRRPPVVVQQGCLGLASAIEGDSSYMDPTGALDPSVYRGPAVHNPQAPIHPALFDRYGFENEGLLDFEKGMDSIRLNSVKNYIRYHTLSLVEQYKQNGGGGPIHTVILGCTHFPFYLEMLQDAFERLRTWKTAEGELPYAALIAENIRFIDPARLTAIELYTSLISQKLLIEAENERTVVTDEFYISVPNPSLENVELTETQVFSYSYKYGRNPGNLEYEYVKRVPMTGSNLNSSTIEMIQSKMPDVWRRMVRFNVAK
ncbi:MAG: hypothetical protein C4527_12925 [Candidatus Omnitrophota bacterium]|jgi:glutamate racemase|nr:MAG: hypothetical protein C4527_12925 [Candidatus Omnitrophota bacterium]